MDWYSHGIELCTSLITCTKHLYLEISLGYIYNLPSQALLRIHEKWRAMMRATNVRQTLWCCIRFIIRRREHVDRSAFNHNQGSYLHPLMQEPRLIFELEQSLPALCHAIGRKMFEAIIGAAIVIVRVFAIAECRFFCLSQPAWSLGHDSQHRWPSKNRNTVPVPRYIKKRR